jgi:hypothetical protein
VVRVEPDELVSALRHRVTDCHKPGSALMGTRSRAGAKRTRCVSTAIAESSAIDRLRLSSCFASYPARRFAASRPSWCKKYEIKRYRDPARNRRWLVENIATGEGYTLIPGSGDGVADTYARGDVWILRYRGTEIDDGNNWTGSYTEADLDKFRNWELINNQDVVIWYAGHSLMSPVKRMLAIVSAPDLVPNDW